MKKRTNRLYVQDMYTSIEKIERYVFGLTFDEFTKQDLVIDAVIRNFEIIGEAAHHVTGPVRTKHPEFPWKKEIDDIIR
jgi:uncharacterized protein with HEPN domain